LLDKAVLLISNGNEEPVLRKTFAHETKTRKWPTVPYNPLYLEKILTSEICYYNFIV